MPYTTHGHWYGEPSNGDRGTPPVLVANCGGPHVCAQCAAEAHRGASMTEPSRAGRLGRLPNDPAKPRLLLAPHLDTTVPPSPAVVDWLTRVDTWPMYLNDRIGDCVWAMAGHATEAWSTYSQGRAIKVTDQDILTGYETVTGYNPTDPATDQGTVIQDALSYWRKTGIGGHRILAFAQVDHTKAAEVKSALNVFGALLVGVNFPRSAMDQFNARSPWTVIRNDGGIEGGHAIHVGQDEDGVLHAVTWGAVQPLTAAWWAKYVEECWVAISPDWLSATGVSPGGIDLHGLGEDFATLTGSPNPFPGPTPQPDPTPGELADRQFAAALRPWLSHHHIGATALVARAAKAWLTARGL